MHDVVLVDDLDVTLVVFLELFESRTDPQAERSSKLEALDNRDLRVAVARIDQAAAALGLARADLYPRVYYGGTAGFSAFHTDGTSDTEVDASVFLDASWQIDLWGRFRRANEAAFQELLATEEGFRGVTISLVAAVASAYLQLRDLDNRQAIAERTGVVRQQN